MYVLFLYVLNVLGPRHSPSCCLIGVLVQVSHSPYLRATVLTPHSGEGILGLLQSFHLQTQVTWQRDLVMC